MGSSMARCSRSFFWCLCVFSFDSALGMVFSSIPWPNSTRLWLAPLEWTFAYNFYSASYVGASRTRDIENFCGTTGGSYPDGNVSLSFICMEDESRRCLMFVVTSIRGSVSGES